ncbi:hypothetical protein N0V90_003944 [Kalmusia sp. IMI 367209]|nr:hypothetical protein N0V90_003944 [Kalmusia sp. IMI 367209]
MSASKHREGPVPSPPSASHYAKREEQQQTTSSSHQPVTALSLYPLRNLHIQHAVNRTPPTIITGKVELKELPTTYEQIEYGGRPKIGENHQAAIAPRREQATQINTRRKTNSIAVRDVERGSLGVVPYPSSASSDLNKIIRANYGDIFYMQLALEVLKKWNTDPLYKRYFHETSMLFVKDIGMGDPSFENYKKIRVNPEAEILTTDQAQERFPVFKNAYWVDIKDTYYNPPSGWGEADPAIRATIEAALSAGMKYV